MNDTNTDEENILRKKGGGLDKRVKRKYKLLLDRDAIYRRIEIKNILAKYKNMNTYKVLDIFYGIGGVTHGFYKEGFSVVAGIDSDKSYRYVYKKNNKSKFIHKNWQIIENMIKLILNNPYRITRLLVGGATVKQDGQVRPLKQNISKLKRPI